FTKMQGAGNDFVVLDETRGQLGLTPAQYRWLADRHFGVGADQILSVRAAPHAGVDFEYVIHNADGGEVENCGNGARCFARYVRERGLSQRPEVRVQTAAGVLRLQWGAEGQVAVDMGAPVFEPARIPFDATGLQPRPCGGWQVWPLALPTFEAPGAAGAAAGTGAVLGSSAFEAELALVSMGNPHAVWRVPNVDSAPVAQCGPLIERHPRFPRRVNVGFLQVLGRQQARLRVFERGVGETLACGTGACAAVVAGVRHGWFDERVEVQLPGGALTVALPVSRHGLAASVHLSGPAETVFEGVTELPDLS
ncbi:MAG: diaminopimelate epimerase, partial [Serpentinimonas sp.]|nr:diaminopimelate epimerase [Serpentinimonas sp.]